MQQYRKNLGKVSLTAEGAWDGSKAFGILSIVYDEHTQHGFISRQAVPEGVDLYNKEYWMPFNVSGYADNNVIILSKKTAEHAIQSYTLEEAIASIKSVGRRPGAILGFYNENADRLDIGGRWELWQFNDTNIYNWDNVDSWQNLYYNYNKFMGWFKDENFLNKYAPFPEIGCYAFVGSEFNEATVYRCDNKYVWKNTTQHAWDYVKVVVDGNVTVGENGNWFNNGEDTGIPASVKGENGKTPVFRENDNTIQYSFDNINWITISDKVAAWFRWNATTGDTQANNVGRIQISRDNVTWINLSGDIINSLHISHYIGADESLPTSGVAEGTIYAKGPTYADGDTSHSNPIYRLWVYAWKGNTLAWQDNGEFTSIAAGVVQETGDSETEVMSQKAVTEKLSELGLKSQFALWGNNEIRGRKVNINTEEMTFTIEGEFSFLCGNKWHLISAGTKLSCKLFESGNPTSNVLIVYNTKSKTLYAKGFITNGVLNSSEAVMAKVSTTYGSDESKKFKGVEWAGGYVSVDGIIEEIAFKEEVSDLSNNLSNDLSNNYLTTSYSVGYINADNKNKQFVLSRNVVFIVDNEEVIIPKDYAITYEEITPVGGYLYKIVLSNNELKIRSRSDNREGEKVFATFAINEYSNVSKIDYCAITSYIDGVPQYSTLPSSRNAYKLSVLDTKKGSIYNGSEINSGNAMFTTKFFQSLVNKNIVFNWADRNDGNSWYVRVVQYDENYQWIRETPFAKIDSFSTDVDNSIKYVRFVFRLTNANGESVSFGNVADVLSEDNSAIEIVEYDITKDLEQLESLSTRQAYSVIYSIGTLNADNTKKEFVLSYNTIFHYNGVYQTIPKQTRVPYNFNLSNTSLYGIVFNQQTNQVEIYGYYLIPNKNVLFLASVVAGTNDSVDHFVGASLPTTINNLPIGFSPRGFYQGEKITIRRPYGYRSMFSVSGVNWHQSFAIHGDTMITTIYGDSTPSVITAQIIDLTSRSVVGSVELPYGSVNRPHCNVCCFGKEFAEGNNKLPLLYVSQWDYYTERGVLVYNITETDGVYSAELVQTIVPHNISTNILGKGDVDYIVDTDNGYLYALAYYLEGASTIVEGNKEMIVKFRLPTLSEGANVVLTEEDVIDHYETEIFNYSQDKCYCDGKIYVIAGGGNYDSSIAFMNKLWVLDLKQRKVTSIVPLDVTNEPEGMDVYNNELVFDFGVNTLYKFQF